MTVPDVSHEYAHIGRAWDGRPLLRQQGSGPRRTFVLRFVHVQAASEHIAKRIQVAFRADQKAQGS